jgi:hypothetical protein
VENVEKPVEKTGPVKRTRRKRTEDTRWWFTRFTILI